MLKKIWKKIWIVTLALVLCLNLSACGSSEAKATPTQEPGQTAQEPGQTAENAYAGTYYGIGLYQDGQYLLDSYFDSWRTTLNADGSGDIDWEETSGDISAWSVKNGSLIMKAGVSEIEGSLSDGVMLLTLDGGYVLASVSEGFDIGTLNTASLDDYMNAGSGTTNVDTDQSDTEQTLLAPVMEWWELYNPNGFDTLTAVISNPNDVAIDVSYDLVFYKNGTEVSKIEYCSNFSILPGRESIIWVNADVPAAADADDVKLENIYVNESSYPPIDGKYEFAGIIDGDACFDFTFDSKPTLATVWFVLYNDKNGNDRFDKGEIVVTVWDSLMEQTGQASFDTAVHPYSDYEVFFTAY